MKLIIEIPIFNAEDAFLSAGFKTRPFEYPTVVGLKAALKQNAERVVDLGPKAKRDDICFAHAGFEINLKELIVDGVYEEPNVYTVNEFFKHYQTK